MRVMFTINTDEAGAEKAQELRTKIEDLCKAYGLEGSVIGDVNSKVPSYTGAFGKTKKNKKDRPKPVPKQYDPSQYIKPKVEKKDK